MVFATGTCELDRKSEIPDYAAAEDRRHFLMLAKQGGANGALRPLMDVLKKYVLGEGDTAR